MQIHHLPTYEDGYARVVTCHDPVRMLTPAPELPFIQIDEATNSPLYYDVLMNPSKYLVNEAGELFVDEDWRQDEAV